MSYIGHWYFNYNENSWFIDVKTFGSINQLCQMYLLLVFALFHYTILDPVIVNFLEESYVVTAELSYSIFK